MKKTIEFFSWLSVVCTMIALIFTIATTYRFVYIKYFVRYDVLQICIFISMLFWSVKLHDCTTGRKRWIYSAICLAFAFGAIFFMRNDVW